jgi:hypothetical protein
MTRNTPQQTTEERIDDEEADQQYLLRFQTDRDLDFDTASDKHLTLAPDGRMIVRYESGEAAYLRLPPGVSVDLDLDSGREIAVTRSPRNRLAVEWHSRAGWRPDRQIDWQAADELQWGPDGDAETISDGGSVPGRGWNRLLTDGWQSGADLADDS